MTRGPSAITLARLAVWVALIVAATWAFQLIRAPLTQPPVYARQADALAAVFTAEPLAIPTAQPLPQPQREVVSTPLPAVTNQGDQVRVPARRAVNRSAPYCCSSWSVWVDSVEITADGRLRLDVSLHNDTALYGVAYTADPTLVDETGRTYAWRRDLTVAVDHEQPLPAGTSIRGTLYFVAPPPDVKSVDFVYGAGYGWIRGLELP